MTRDFNPTKWITTKEAAELTGYSAAYFRQLIAGGKLEGRKIGRDWVLDKSEVLEYAEEMKRLGPDKYNPWRTGARKREDREE
jgi:excisionase family DNA binding protein